MFIIHYCETARPHVKLTAEFETLALARAVYLEMQADPNFTLLCTCPVDMILFNDMVAFFFGKAYDAQAVDRHVN